MSAVWVVRDDGGNVIRVAPREHVAVAIAAEFGGTVTRETLLTPAHAAVMEAAKVMAGHLRQPPTTDIYSEWLRVKDGLLAAVANLRKQEAQP